MILVVFPSPAQAGITTASCYGAESGNVTASGEAFNPSGLTAAHRTLPFGTQVLFTYGDASVVATVNDRGPYVYDREFDMTCTAMSILGLPPGVYTVGAQVL